MGYLLNFAFLEASIKVTPRAQLRAFHALFIIAPTSVICSISNQTVEELRAYLLALTYAQRLEHLRMSQTPTTFTSSNKGRKSACAIYASVDTPVASVAAYDGQPSVSHACSSPLLRCVYFVFATIRPPHQCPTSYFTLTGFFSGGLARAIWKNHRHEPVAVSLVVDLCIDFEIHDTVLWGNVLKQLVQLSEWNDLARALVAMSATPQLWSVSCVQPSWTALLQEHLRRVKDAYDDDTRTSTRKELLHLAIECPVILQMHFADELKAIGEHGLAAKLSGEVLASPLHDNFAKRITADDTDRGTPAKAKRARPQQPF